MCPSLCLWMYVIAVLLLAQCIRTVAEVIRGNLSNQQMFDQLQTPSTPPRLAPLAILMSMVSDKQPFQLRLAALYCFQVSVWGRKNNPRVMGFSLLCVGTYVLHLRMSYSTARFLLFYDYVSYLKLLCQLVVTSLNIKCKFLQSTEYCNSTFPHFNIPAYPHTISWVHVRQHLAKL